MLLKPAVIVLYVEDITTSSRFYQNILGINPEEASPSFHSFAFSKEMSLALKAQHTVEPPPEGKNGHGELAFVLDNQKQVDELFIEWQAKAMTISQLPGFMPYGYTFVALDPDGHRLRVVSLT